MIWGNSSSGIFSVKSAYQNLCGNQGFPDYIWKGNWSLPIPPKIKIFWWLFVQGKLLTNTWRVRRHLITDSSCYFCPGHEEAMIHLSRDCDNVQQVWRSFVHPANISNTFVLGWKERIAANLTHRGSIMRNLN